MRNYGSHPEDVRNKSEDMMKGVVRALYEILSAVGRIV